MTLTWSVRSSAARGGDARRVPEQRSAAATSLRRAHPASRGRHGRWGPLQYIRLSCYVEGTGNVIMNRKEGAMAPTLVSARDTATLDACRACQEACESCAYDCCASGPDTAECTRLCLDCATICAATATLIARGSPWAASLAEVCARVCAECAAECARHDDEACRECAAVCRRCAEQCRSIAASTA